MAFENYFCFCGRSALPNRLFFLFKINYFSGFFFLPKDSQRMEIYFLFGKHPKKTQIKYGTIFIRPFWSMRRLKFLFLKLCRLIMPQLFSLNASDFLCSAHHDFYVNLFFFKQNDIARAIKKMPILKMYFQKMSVLWAILTKLISESHKSDSRNDPKRLGCSKKMRSINFCDPY